MARRQSSSLSEAGCRRWRGSGSKAPSSPLAALPFLLFLAASFVISSSTTTTVVAASRILLSSDAGPALPLVGAAFEEQSSSGGGGADAASASASGGQVSAEAFRGGGRGWGISNAAEAVAAAAAEPLPQGSPNLSDASAAAPTAAETPPPAATETPVPPPPPSTTAPPPSPTTTSVSTSSQASEASAPSTPPPSLPPLAVSSDGHLTAGGGAPVELRGLNWFGFEAGQTFVDGTSWSGSGSALSHDALSVLWRIKLLGFNAVRLPFSFMEFAKTPRDVTSKCDWVGDAEIARSVAPPGVELPAAALAAVPKLFDGAAAAATNSNEGHGGGASDPPPAVTPAPGTQGLWENKVTCNADVPSTSVKDRLIWLVKKCVAAGIYVVLDDHISYDTTILDDRAKWVSSWRELAADLAKEPSLAGAVMLDIVNEPDSRGIRWSSGPNGQGPGMQELYVEAMDAIAEVNPWALLLVEGCGQLGNLAMNWGDGFATDPAALAAAEGSPQSAAPFFDAVATKSYADRVVLAPHIYPPSVSRQEQKTQEPELTARMDSSFGYLGPKGTGYCGSNNNNNGGGGNGSTSTTCRKFPILIGEVGSKLEDPRDPPFLEAFSSYLNGGITDSSDEEGIRQKRKVQGAFWWSWNANSGDTGGLVKDDWVSLHWAKLAWMNAATGLQPWYVSVISAEGEAGGGGGALPGADTSLPTPPPETTAPTPPPPPQTTAPPAETTAAATPPPPTSIPPPPSPPPPPETTLPAAPPTTTVTTTTPAATLPPLPLPLPSNSSSPLPPPLTCLALVLSTREVPHSADSSSASSSTSEPTHEVTLAITSATPVCAPYALELYAPGYGALRTARGWVPSDNGAPTAGVLRGTVPEKWQGLGGGMGAVTLSFVVRGGPQGAEGAPAAVAVNGAPCAVAKA